MLLIKYDGITNVKDAIKYWGVDPNYVADQTLSGFYYIEGDILKFSNEIKNLEKHIIYASSVVAKWTSYDVFSLPIEIFEVICKRCKKKLSGCTTLISCFIFSEQPEGFGFWTNIHLNKFHKFYEEYNNINTIINYETKLQDKNSSIIRGEEPKRSIICGKKGCASITSGSIKYGRISRGK